MRTHHVFITCACHRIVPIAASIGLPRPIEMSSKQFVKWLEQVSYKDVPIVGGKNASLGEMIRELQSKKIAVPGGFCTTADAYRYYIAVNELEPQLREIFKDLDTTNGHNLRERGKKARQLILQTPFPEDLIQAIADKYKQLCARYSEGETSHDDLDVAVRSSATAEDLPDASFAGQQETFLNVQGVKGVLQSCQQCFASLFTDRAISYRVTKGFDHFAVALSVGVQKMVRSESAGVMFTINTENGFKDHVFVTASYGLGELVVQGSVNPDEHVVFKPSLRSGKKAVLENTLGSKENKMIYAEGGSKQVKIVPVSLADRDKFCLSEAEVETLARWGCAIESHYNTPMDIEWAKDGISGDLWIVQARPETVQSLKQLQILRSFQLTEKPSQLLATGCAVGSMIGQGKACVIKDVHNITKFRAGDVLVTNRTDPDWEPIMKQAKAIVTNSGGRACHAAIIARELGIPAVVGCANATDVISDGNEVTVSCADGNEGKVFSGLLGFKVNETKLDSVPATKTKIMVNVGNPDEATTVSFLPNKGVGLARMEFIIANHIRVHPLALIEFDSLEDLTEKNEIQHLTRKFSHKPDFFVDKLCSGIAMIAAAFHPKPVIVRLSDFKSNEYSHLLGGKQFEPKEENPMLGWRGASRYYDSKFEPAFALECRALKKVRDEMGLDNVIPMVPFCRTPEEGKKVIATMSKHGLTQGENGLQIYMMCEIPSNVILVDEFCKVFDGFSIGSNDLTQLTLGLDRDSGLVAHLFDERNGAVQAMIQNFIINAKRNGRKVGICGQAPSDYPEFARFLVKCGIDSISLNPDTVLSTLLDIASFEDSI